MKIDENTNCTKCVKMEIIYVCVSNAKYSI